MKTILIIEDNPDLQLLYKAEFEKEEFTVLQAFDGQTGLQSITPKTVDLILLDVMLPRGMNGFDVLGKIKEDPALKKIPVIMLTNLLGEEKTALSLGADDYILKAETTITDIIKKVKKRLRPFGL